MDNRWQVKCGTALQTTPSNDPSSPQQPRNQMETASGQLLYPPAEFNLRSQVKGTMANNTFHGSGHAEPGNSFLGILSGPASLLQCDFQELSNPKLLTTTNRTRIDSSGGSTAVCGIESLPPLKSSGLPSQNVSHQHLRNGTAVGPNSALQYGLQTHDPATRLMDFSNEKIKDASSTRGQWQSINATNTAKHQDTNDQLQPKVSIEAQHSVSDNSSDFSNGCPRVFCSGISGDLLLSNTGLLGVLCSCHCFHMSISKFCEHSGLWNANPGDDVRMESGESIALWRKLYFQKFGIRVPEDQSGWNWPEGLSLVASLMKPSMSMPTSKNSDCMHLPGSFGGEVRSRQRLDNIVLPKDSFVEGFNNRPQRNVKNGDKFLGLAGNSQSYACGVEDRLVVECPISRHSIVPSDVGRGLENGPHSVSAYFDANAKNGSVSTANRNLQNLRALINSGKSSGGKNALIVDKDTSSSIELRLGQPNHQSQPSGNLALSGIGSQLPNTLFNLQKPSSEEQMIHYVISSVEERQSRQLLPVSGLSNPTSRMERDQSNHRQCTASNTYHAAKQEKLNGDQAETSLTSLSEHFIAPSWRSLYSKFTNNALNVREHIISERLHCEPHTAKSNPVKIHWNVGSGLEREWTAPELGCFRPVDKGKAVGCLTGNSSCVSGSGSKMQKWMENLSLLSGMASGNSDSGCSVVHDNNHHHFSSILSGAPSSGTFSNHLEKGTCFGNGPKDHTLVRSMGSQPRVSEKILTSQVVPLGVKASTSSSLPVLTPVLSQQGGIGGSTSSLDDNLRSIALRQILELSKQQHALLSLAENLEQRRCNDKLCCSLVEPSRYEEICHGPTHPCRQYVSEIPMKPIPSGPARKMDNNKFTPVTGFNNWCNLSTVTKGLPLQHKETEMHCQLSHDALQHEQHSLRLGRSETNTESFCQGTHIGQGNCSCTTHTKCLGGKLMLTEGNPPISFTEQMGGVSDKASALIAQDNHFALKESTVSLDQFRKLGEQLRKNVSCHTYQWKDVPSKTKPVCDQVVCVKQSADTTDSREHDVGRPGDNTMKCPNIASSLAAVCTEDSFKEQEMSNISSGCSAPVVTQISVEVNNVDSSSTVAANIGYVNHRLVDEGSGIDKCWSSDDALESDRSAEFSCSACLKTMKKDASFRAINSQSSRSLLDEVKLMDSLTWKRGQNQMHTGISVHEKSNSSQDCEKGLKTGKRKREIKLKVLDASLEAVGPAECAKHIEYDTTSKRPPFPADVETVSLAQETSLASGGHSSKPISKRVKCHSTSFLPKPCSRKREAPGEDDCRAEQINNGSSCRIAETADRKKFKGTGSSDACAQLQIQEPTHSVNDCNTIARPVVCGNYGEMSDGRMTGDVPVKYKFVSLQKVLKTARRCTLPKTCKPGQTLLKELKRTKLSWRYEKVSNLKRKIDNALGYEGVNLHDSMKGKGPSTCAYQGSANESLVLEKEKGKEIEKASSVLDSQTEGQPKAKFKELRSRNLNELSLTGKNSSSEMVSHKKILNCALKRRAKTLDNDSDSGSDDSFCISGSYKISTKRYTQKQKKSPTKESFCCVCGTSSQDEINCLLECGRCLIRVHQACYGVSQVPKHTWYCRPCRTGSENIVCVLCGYGGGAMTRALRCRSIMKTFSNAWGLETDRSQKSASLSAETLQDELTMLRSSGSMVESTSFPSLRPVNVEPSTSAHCNTVMPNQFDTSQSSLACVSNVKASNSIAIGMLDTTVKQWVHMVCGLWTPETRCPNVDTMSAFDVSGVSCHRANTVCSMCDRLGGSCIQCRVVNCSIPFHPWCAHQKGLLQSEVEGVDNENVGFYGRCFLHATYPANENACDIVDVDTGCPAEEKESCARTEGYKGRKRDGFWHNLHGQSRGNGGCLVPQEQINAWIHINGQKSFVQGLSKPPMSDAEHDCRKEYTRYKQARGWKHLVVYKSGIHALGLYTSRFISRSEMVVEYIGEIVGQRVADKREIEYQSGRKLQYKSACYFFRIDKEHIIDATQMGGIARFVNHSCQPNCVAKVITVRNEKKVVFFAVRDIYPGEEITYDYHFNHEDEGKKIPCFCNSKNCRRYLN